MLDIDELKAKENIVGLEVGSTELFSADLYFELGQWLCGLENFCSIGYPVFLQGRERSTPDRRCAAELQQVRKVEAEPNDETLNELRTELRSFLSEPVSYLFYKDCETFDRFCNEIELTVDLANHPIAA